MLMYNLTEMTGREATSQRTVIIGSVELNKRAWYLMIASFPVGVIFGALLWPLLGELAIFAVPVVAVGALFLFHWRSNNGLRLRYFESIMDKRRARVGEAMLANQAIDIAEQSIYNLMQNHAPYPKPAGARKQAPGGAGTPRRPQASNDVFDEVFA